MWRNVVNIFEKHLLKPATTVDHGEFYEVELMVLAAHLGSASTKKPVVFVEIAHCEGAQMSRSLA